MILNFIKSFNKKSILFLNIFLLFCAMIITIFSIITGSYIQKKESIQVGSVANKKYLSPIDSIDIIATEKLKKEARDSVGPLYKHNPEVESLTINAIPEYFSELDIMLERYNSGENLDSLIKSTSFKIPVPLSYTQYMNYNSLDFNDRQRFINDIQNIMKYIYEQGVTEDTKSKADEIASEKMNSTSWNNDLKEMGINVMSNAIKPNLVFDEESVQATKEKKESEVSDVLIKKNQKIVDEGEIITQEIYDKLKVLNLIDNDNVNNFIPFFGVIIITILIFVAVLIYFFTEGKKNINRPEDSLMIFTIYIVSIIMIRITANITNFIFVPTVMFAMLIAILIDIKMAIIFNIFFSIICTFIFNCDMQYTLYFFITGTFSALFMQYTDKRNRIIFVAVGVALVNFITRFSLGLFFQNGYSTLLLKDSAYSALIAIISLIVTVGSLPLWEATFEANTTIKLLELSNPNNEVLRRLMIEAPGTYHHSLMVANLAERAALDIGANATLARVGAYYHDIGKLKYPLYFSENQVGENPHDNLEPHSSAKIIIQHITAGIELADEKRLPKSIKSIIVEHQGTTLIKYFYAKAVKQYSNECVNENDFRYFGPIPQSRESAIVMLADTVEAAVRSILKGGNDIKAADEIIKTLIKDKFEDGQLNESDLKIQDLEIIRESFVKVFEGMYHERVSYPKIEDINSIKNSSKNREI